MSHSVSRHLRLEIDTYDASIRRFIPGYEVMLEEAIDAVLEVGWLDRVVDLGSGTGALAERLLERHPMATVELWDIDPEMLDKARERLARFGDRARFFERSFGDSIGEADAVMASLSLHHVRETAAKQALYRSIARSLRPGGVFVNADVTMPRGQNEAQADYQHWADHLVASGIPAREAWRHFEAWSEEDHYLPLEVEMAGLAEAGLEPGCRWRAIPSTVLVGRKPDA